MKRVVVVVVVVVAPYGSGAISRSVKCLKYVSDKFMKHQNQNRPSLFLGQMS